MNNEEQNTIEQYNSLKLNFSTHNSSNIPDKAAEVKPLSSAAPPILTPEIKEKYIEKCNTTPLFKENKLQVFDTTKIRVEPSGIGFYVLLGVILALGLSFVGAIYMGFLSINIDQPIYNNNAISINSTINTTVNNAYDFKPTIVVNNNYTITNKIYINSSQ